jgi:hypothetical protein
MNMGISETEIDKKKNDKVLAFIDKKIEEEDGLASILILLQHKGYEYEEARTMVKSRALLQAQKTKTKSIKDLVLGLIAVIVFLFVGWRYPLLEEFYYISFGAFVSGLYFYGKSVKRLKYLRSIR